MEFDQIAKLKANIKNEYEEKIASLRLEMKSVLSALDRAEKTLSTSPKGPKAHPVQQELVSEDKQPSSSLKTAKARVNEALKRMDSNFKKQELWDLANSIGVGTEIKAGTMAPLFANLVKSGVIETIVDSKGKTPAIYRRA